jgi:CubicO group peptidase (beta-lactamase class C family)
MSLAAILMLGLLTGGSSRADALAAAVEGEEFPRTTSVLLLQSGTPVYERYFGTTAETLHDPRSVGKSVTSLAVGIAIAEGKIASINARAFDPLRDLAPFANDDAGKRGITIGDLLTMSSALNCDDDARKSPGNEMNMYPLRSWARWAVDLPVKAQYVRDQSGRGPFSYCTAGVFLLGQILQRATGEPVDRYIETRLLRPLGITQQEWTRSPTGEVMTGGMLRLRTRDLAKLGTLLLQRGTWAGKQVVPARWIDDALSVQRRPNAAQDPTGELAYGYLFYRRDYATPCGRTSGWFMSGNGGNHVVILKDLDAVAVVTTVNYNTRGMHAQTTRLLEQHLLPKLACREGGGGRGTKSLGGRT